MNSRGDLQPSPTSAMLTHFHALHESIRCRPSRVANHACPFPEEDRKSRGQAGHLALEGPKFTHAVIRSEFPSSTTNNRLSWAHNTMRRTFARTPQACDPWCVFLQRIPVPVQASLAKPTVYLAVVARQSAMASALAVSAAQTEGSRASGPIPRRRRGPAPPSPSRLPRAFR